MLTRRAGSRRMLTGRPPVVRRGRSLRQANAALRGVKGFGSRVLRVRGGKRHRSAKQK
jgi:hypothetical protein